MSSLPGYTLESFVAWQWNLIVEEQSESNVSLGMAEFFGTVSRRKTLTQTEFKEIISLYLPYRQVIEERLADFDEETQSWRGYAEVVDPDIPEEVQRKIGQLVKELTLGDTSWKRIRTSRFLASSYL